MALSTISLVPVNVVIYVGAATAQNGQTLLVDATAGASAIAAPPVVANGWFKVAKKDTVANAVTVTGIFGGTVTVGTTQGSAKTFVSDGTAWYTA